MSIHSKSSNALATPPSQVQQFVWTVRREFWEHRSLYIAPFVMAVVVLAGYLFLIYQSFGHFGELGKKGEAAQRALLLAPFGAATFAIMATAALAALYYSLDALYGERRDRSILFWKSLPISDTTTVLAKLAVPLVAMIPIELAIISLTQLAMFVAGSVSLTLSGSGVGLLWKNFPFVKMLIGVVYGLTVTALWYAPVYAWFLLVSAWAKRGPMLWAIVPFFALAVIERVGAGTTRVLGVVERRIFGGIDAAFSTSEAPVAIFGDTTNKSRPADSLSILSDAVSPDPMKFFSNLELWIGLVLAVVFVIAAIQVRRKRGPI
jgi:ABC-2 type transport system permease protein